MSDSNSNIPQTPEAVAFQLMERILKLEGKLPDAHGIQSAGNKDKYPSRQEILDTYQQCLKIIKDISVKEID
jgi:hypothetical protein